MQKGHKYPKKEMEKMCIQFVWHINYNKVL